MEYDSPKCLEGNVIWEENNWQNFGDVNMNTVQ